MLWEGGDEVHLHVKFVLFEAEVKIQDVEYPAWGVVAAELAYAVEVDGTREIGVELLDEVLELNHLFDADREQILAK